MPTRRRSSSARWLATLNPRPIIVVCTPQQAAQVWHVRESALGAVAIQPGKPHGWEGWEDAAVPPDRLGSYLRTLFALMREYGYDSPLYGHFGDGCVHMRINFDLESEPGILKFREFVDRAAEIVSAHGGSISGEHGDGQARGALLPKMFGPGADGSVPRVQAAVGSRQQDEPGQAHRCAGAARGSSSGGRLPAEAGRHAFPLSQRRRIAGECDAALCGRGRVPQDRGRRDVPQLHGDARGKALHARPGAPAVGDCCRAK